MSQRRNRGEEGHLMAGLMAAIAIMMIFSTMVFQVWSETLRRDNEAEMIFRAEDISRAIQRYRQDHGGQSPLKLEDLMEPGPKGQYYLRKLYEDPLVKDGKWGLLYVGPGGTIVDPNAQEQGIGSGRESQIGGLGQAGSISNQRQSPLQQQGQQQAQDPNNPLGGIGNRGNSTGEGTGLPIAGVRSLTDDKPFRVRNGLVEYREWQFTYFDVENGGGQNATPGQQPGQPGTRPGSGPRGRGPRGRRPPSNTRGNGIGN